MISSFTAYAATKAIIDLFVKLGFGLMGIFLRAGSYLLASVVIGVILEPLLENNLRRSLLISQDGYWIFLDRPVSALLLGINVLLNTGAIWFAIRRGWKSDDVPEVTGQS